MTNQCHFMDKFPSDPNLRAQWIKALEEGNEQINVYTLPKNPKICSRHFIAENIEKHGFMHLRLKPNSIPSIFPNATKKSDTISGPCQSVENCGPAQDNNVLLTKATENVQSAPVLIDYEEEVNQHGIINNQQEAEEIPINQIVTTPKKLRYPGDVRDDRIADMTPRTTVKAIRMLKRVNEKKTKTIKRLCTQIQRQKKKI